MLKQTILVTSLLLAASQAQAETSWFNNALNSLGLGSEKTEENVQLKSAEDALKAAASEDKASAIATEASQMVTDNAAMSSLTGLVTAQLGVTEQQAQGGLGTLFSVAQSTLDGADFQQLSEHVPEMASLLGAAPEVSERTKGISSLVAETGKYGDALKSGNEAYAQFKTLGLDAAQIPQYIEITNQFLKKQGGTDIASLFSKGLDALM
jgi:hypothetical protein